jgi:hypothetical protein
MKASRRLLSLPRSKASADHSLVTDDTAIIRLQSLQQQDRDNWIEKNKGIDKLGIISGPCA